MRIFVAAFALLALDASWRRNADPSKFELVSETELTPFSSMSPAGNALALYQEAGVTITDVRGARPQRTLAGPAARVHDSGWSRDGRVFAASGFDAMVRVWDVETGRELAAIAAHSGYA